jgi:hypothetical protein
VAEVQYAPRCFCIFGIPSVQSSVRIAFGEQVKRASTFIATVLGEVAEKTL